MCSNCGNNSNKEANNLVLIQDVISIKSYLQKLRRILHDVSIFFSDFLKSVSDLEKLVWIVLWFQEEVANILSSDCKKTKKSSSWKVKILHRQINCYLHTYSQVPIKRVGWIFIK